MDILWVVTNMQWQFETPSVNIAMIYPSIERAQHPRISCLSVCMCSIQCDACGLVGQWDVDYKVEFPHKSKCKDQHRIDHAWSVSSKTQRYYKPHWTQLHMLYHLSLADIAKNSHPSFFPCLWNNLNTLSKWCSTPNVQHNQLEENWICNLNRVVRTIGICLIQVEHWHGFHFKLRSLSSSSDKCSNSNCATISSVIECSMVHTIDSAFLVGEAWSSANHLYKPVSRLVWKMASCSISCQSLHTRQTCFGGMSHSDASYDRFSMVSWRSKHAMCISAFDRFSFCTVCFTKLAHNWHHFSSLGSSCCDSQCILSIHAFWKGLTFPFFLLYCECALEFY